MTDQSNAPAPAGGEQSPIGGARPAGETPAPAETEGAAATPQDTDQTSDANEDGDEGQKPEAPKVPRSAVRKINRLERALEAAERRAHELAMAAVSRGGDAQRPAQQQDAVSAKPKLENFTSYDEYQRAHEAWLEETLLTKAEKRIQDRMRTNAERQSHETKAKAYVEATKKAAERYADFEDVAHNPDLPITPAMAQMIAESDKSADLAYHLGSHPEEAARISKLNPLQQARELGRIEATLQPPAARKTTSAPDPVKTVGGKDSPGKNPEKMSNEEYRAAREAGKI